MQMINSISITEPCMAAWDEMPQAANGRYCLHCTKTVVDFSVMTDREVMGYLSAPDKICGRFEETQLCRINYAIALKQPTYTWRRLITTATFISLFPVITASAAPASKSKQRLLAFKPAEDFKLAERATGKRDVKGIVTSMEDNQPLSGVSVVVKGTSTGTQTLADGSFTLRSLIAADTLVLTSIGYQQIEMTVEEVIKGPDISLASETRALEEVHVVNNVIAHTRHCILGSVSLAHKKIPFYLRWWYWLRHQFEHIISAIAPSFNE